MIKCPRCQRESHHPLDEHYGYCPWCHWWTSDPRLGDPEIIAAAEKEGLITPLDRLLDK